MEKLTGLFGLRFFDARHPDQTLCLLRCHHSEIDAVRQILQEHPLKPAEVKHITVGVENRALSHVGTVGPEKTSPEPNSVAISAWG